MLDLPDKVKHYMKSVEKTEKVDYVKLKEQYNLFIELENELKTHNKLNYPLCIPSCRNRKPSLLDRLDVFGDSEIYVFNYENEVDLYKWLDKPNVHKITVPLEYLSIQKMRQFIQNYMGDKIYWAIDDDYNAMFFPWKLKKLNEFEGLHLLELLIDKEFPTHDFSAISPTHLESACRFFHGDLFKYGFASLCLYNGKVLREHNLYYTGDNTVDEAAEFTILSWLHGCPVKTTRAFQILEYAPTGGSNTIACTNEKVKKMGENIAKKYPDYITVRWSKTGKVPTQRIHYSKLKKFLK